MHLCVLSNFKQILFFLKNLFFQTFSKPLVRECVSTHVLYIRYLYPWYIYCTCYVWQLVWSRQVSDRNMQFYILNTYSMIYISHVMYDNPSEAGGISSQHASFYILDTFSVIYIAHVIHHNVTGRIVLYIGYVLRDIYCTCYLWKSVRLADCSGSHHCFTVRADTPASRYPLQSDICSHCTL